MNILIVHNQYQIHGGEDTVVVNEKSMLEKNGNNVFLYIRNNSEISKWCPFRKVLLPLISIFSIKSFREIKLIIEKHKIDIVHVHNTLAIISPSVYYAALVKKVPVVQTLHNFRLICPGATMYRENKICEDCLNHGYVYALKYKCYRNSFFQTLVLISILNIHILIGIYSRINYICLTKFNKLKLLSINKNKEIINKNRVFIKPNYSDNLYEIVSFKNRKKQFVYAGRLEAIKGIRLLLSAWQSIKEFELIICGVGPEEEWCKSFIHDNKLYNIKMMGFIQSDELKAIFSESLALIFPTQWYEGFPMTIVEAFSCGTPVIVGNIGNAGNIIEEGKTGLKFIYDSVDDLISKIYNFPDMVDNVKNEYMSKYSMNTNYNQLITIYNEIINSNRNK